MGDSPLTLKHLFAASQVPSAWRALAVTASSSTNRSCPALLLLDHAGRSVNELPMCKDSGTLRPDVRRWPLGQIFDGALQSMSPLDDVSSLCGNTASAPWALHAITEKG